jgi:hypothetical protein
VDCDTELAASWVHQLSFSRVGSLVWILRLLRYAKALEHSIQQLYTFLLQHHWSLMVFEFSSNMHFIGFLLLSKAQDKILPVFFTHYALSQGTVARENDLVTILARKMF